MAWSTAGNIKGRPGEQGVPGVSVTSSGIRGTDGHLIITLSNGVEMDAGLAKGARGADGTSVTIVGQVANAAALPTNLTASDNGKGYITADNGNLHVWSGTAFNNVGPVKGPQGDKGNTGNVGPRGSQWFIGTGAPTGTNTAGSLPGDKYLDSASGDVYNLT